MRSFDQIFAIAAGRHGGKAALERKLEKPKPVEQLKNIPDAWWLAGMARAVFNSGFNWKVVESKWSGFESAFSKFDPNKVAMLSDDDLDRLTKDTRIIRHAEKIRSVRENAVFLLELKKERGKGDHQLAIWPSTDFVGLLEMLSKRGSRLGGNTGPYFLRAMGRDGFILNDDGVGRLIEEKVIDRPPTSKRAMRAVQDAFNVWMDESGRSLMEISRVIAMSHGDPYY